MSIRPGVTMMTWWSDWRRAFANTSSMSWGSSTSGIRTRSASSFCRANQRLNMFHCSEIPPPPDDRRIAVRPSELETHAELYLARGVGQRSHASEVGAGDCGVRGAPNRAVEQVKGLQPELEARLLDAERARDRDVL